MARVFWVGLLSSMFLLACSSGSGDPDAGPDVDAGDGGGGDTAQDAGSDAGGDQSTDVLDECVQGLQPTGPWGFLVIQDFTTEDQSIHIRIALEPGSDNTVGETIPYHLIRFAMLHPDGSFCLDQESDLDYEWGHHNWDETGKARHADVEYTFRNLLNIVGPGGWEDTLEAHSPPGGTLLWGPLALNDAGCGTVPPGNLNACLQRDRTDR